MADLYIATSFRAYFVSDESAIVVTGTGGVEFVSALAARALRLCSMPRLLEAHIECVERRFPSAGAAQVRALIGNLVSRQLLGKVTSASEGVIKRGALTITTLCVPTADRPQFVERCVRSFLAHLREHSHDIRVVIIDDSRDEGNARETRKIAARLGSDSSQEVRYLGRSEKERMQSHLVARGVSKEMAEFAVPIDCKQFSAGGNRNAMLLATAGELVLSVDDDTVCRPWRSPQWKRGLELWDHEDRRYTRFFGSRQDALCDQPSGADDWVASHESLLGWTLRHLIDTTQGEIDISHACEHFISMVHERGNAKVRATFSGLAGDGASYCPYRLLFAKSGDAKTQMASSYDAYQMALQSREMRRIANRNAVTHDSSCMAYALAIDNTELLPPFMPTGTCEDGVFGAFLASCDPHAVFGHVAHGIVHDSCRRSRYESGQIKSATCVRISDIVLALVKDCEIAPHVSQIDVRMRRLGEHLTDISKLNMASFDELVRHLVVETLRRDLEIATWVRRHKDEYPEYWQMDLAEYMRMKRSCANDERFYVPIELRWADQRAAMHELQSLICRLGELLQTWPQMVTIATEAGCGLNCSGD